MSRARLPAPKEPGCTVHQSANQGCKEPGSGVLLNASPQNAEAAADSALRPPPHRLTPAGSHWKTNFPSRTLHSKTGGEEGEGELTHVDYSPFLIRQVCGPPSQPELHKTTTSIHTSGLPTRQGQPGPQINLCPVAMAHELGQPQRERAPVFCLF